MNYIKDIKLKEDNSYNVIIEIVKGSKDKNELVEGTFDKVQCVRKIKYKYPYYYGCFPQTLAMDKDALDIILLTKKKYNVLDIVKVRVLGVIKTVDCNELDLKVLVIPVDESIKNIEKLVKKAIKFLSKYKGKQADMYLDTKVYEDAEIEIDKCHKRYLGYNSIRSL